MLLLLAGYWLLYAVYLRCKCVCVCLCESIYLCKADSLFSRSAGKPELYQNEMLLVLLAYQTNFDCCSSTPTITTHLNILSILLGRLICRTLSDTRTRCPYNTQCCIARHTLNHRVCGIFHTDGGIFFLLFIFSLSFFSLHGRSCFYYCCWCQCYWCK